MNRWHRWAQSLRARHVRKLAWHGAPAQVLLHPIPAPVLGSHAGGDSRLLRHLHVHIAWRLPPSLPVSVPLWAHAAGTVWYMLPPSPRHLARAGETLMGSDPGLVSSTRTSVSLPVWHQTVQRAAAKRTGMTPGPRLSAQQGIIRLAPRSIDNTIASIAEAALQSRATVLRIRGSMHREDTRNAPPAAVLARPQRPMVEPVPDPAPTDTPRGARLPAAHAAPSYPSIDVDALTGIVMQQIDRRLVAYRERMGRT